MPNSAEALRIEYTYHSNAIEGSTLSLRETQLVIEGLTPPGGKPLREIYEARNHYRAIGIIESWAGANGIGWLTEVNLLELHAAVLADISPGDAGVYRSGRVLIAGSRFVPPGPHRFEELIPTTLDRARASAMHPVMRAAELHYNLVAVHPFVDGNGRTARLMMNALLLSLGYPLCIIRIEQRSAYLAALDAANAGDAVPFAGLVADVVQAALRDLAED